MKHFNVRKVLAIIFIGFMVAVPSFGGAATVEELIREIQAKIAVLQAQLLELQQQGGGTTWCHTFNTNLTFGSSGAEVLALNRALSLTDLTLNDNVGNSVFNEDTAADAVQFQAKYGIRQTGYVGPITRAKLNSLYGCGGTIQKGSLHIEPANASLKVGEKVQLRAFYDPPMPICPAGAYCAQVMPASYPVWANWGMADDSHATLTGGGGGGVNGVEIIGKTSGTNVITATYTTAAGTVLTASTNITVTDGTAQPVITILSPNGGEVWPVGSVQTVSLYAPTVSAGTYFTFGLRNTATGADTALGAYQLAPNYQVTVPNSLSAGQYLFFVKASVNGIIISDWSDAPFMITGLTCVASTVGAPVLTNIDPSSGPIGTKVTITGTGFSYYNTINGTGPTGQFQVSSVVPSCDGKTLTFIVPATLMNVNWASQPVAPGVYQIQVGSTGGSSNNLNFTVTATTSQPSIVILSPNGGETLEVGKTYQIRWSSPSLGDSKSVQIGIRDLRYSSEDSGRSEAVIANTINNNGSYSWTVPANLGGVIFDGGNVYKIVIYYEGGSVGKFDISDAPFTVTATPASSPSLNVSPTTVTAGGSVTATWSGIANPTAKDWIGLYVPGTPDNPHIAWIYVSCMQTAVSATANGSCSFPIPSNLAPGTYELRLMANDGYTRLAVSNSSFKVMVAGSIIPTLTPSSLSVTPGSNISVIVMNAPGGVKDWVAIFPQNATGAQFSPDWQYLNGSKTAPTSPITNATLTFTATTTPGMYQFRLYRNDSTSESDKVASANFNVISSGMGTTVSNPNLASTLAGLMRVLQQMKQWLNTYSSISP